MPDRTQPATPFGLLPTHGNRTVCRNLIDVTVGPGSIECLNDHGYCSEPMAVFGMQRKRLGCADKLKAVPGYRILQVTLVERRFSAASRPDLLGLEPGFSPTALSTARVSPLMSCRARDTATLNLL